MMRKRSPAIHNTAWLPVRGEKHCQQHDITLVHAQVESIDATTHTFKASDGPQ